MSAPARIPDRDIAYIRDANPIIDVARELGYELEPRGDGNYVMPCFDSADRDTNATSSMSVIPERGMFYCFHCSAGGDVIALVEKDKKLSFLQAVAFLAARCGIVPGARQEPTPDPAAARAAKALHQGIPEAIEERDLDALISNLAGWFTTGLEVREAALHPNEETP